MKEVKQDKISRRSFVKTAAMAAAGAPLFNACSYARVIGANDRIRTGIIGCGGMARAHLNALLDMRESDNVEVAAVCDVYATRAERFGEAVAEAGGRAWVLSEPERVLEMKDLDVVTVATPEHWHAQLTLDALDAGLHVYVEKPMTHDVDEAFDVLEKAQHTGLKVQVGVQGMSDDSYESAYRAIRAGKLGPVIEAQIDYVRHYPEGQGPWRSDVDPDMEKPVDLDWEQWLGPAPYHPWSPNRYFEWRNYRDYSGGIASDLFIHRLTRILKACGLGFPTQVVGMGGIFLWDDGRELPDNLEMLAKYPAVEGVTPGMTVHVLGTMGNARGNDHLIRGHDATLVFTREGWEIIPQGADEPVETHVKSGGERVDLHHRNHHAAIREGAELHCSPELGLAGVVAICGANQSWFDGKLLTWDAANRQWT